MCLNRRKIYTNAHHLSYDSYEPYELYIKCGQCTECTKQYKDEWTMRTYWEVKRCLDQGGWALWEGLSYDNDHLPHLNKKVHYVPDDYDFVCFDQDDLTLLWKKIRRHYEAKNIKIKDSLKYICCAEYGQEEDPTQRNRFTLRPHYHILMLCNSSQITPQDLSQVINQKWGKGRTAGIDYWQGGYRSWAEDHVITSETQSKAIEKAYYMGKYAMKNQDYDKVAKFKVDQLMNYWASVEWDVENLPHVEDWQHNEMWQKKKREILRKVKTFHRQSQGWGYYAIDHGGIRNQKLGMPGKDVIYWTTTLPLYYERKLYWSYTRNPITKQIRWYMTDTGVARKIAKLEETTTKMAKAMRMKEQIYATEAMKKTIQLYDLEQNKIFKTKWTQKDSEEKWYKLNDAITYYLNGRSWDDYINYTLYHKGRIAYHRQEPIDTIISNNLRKKSIVDTRTGDKIYNYCHTNDTYFFKRQLVSCRDLGDKFTGYLSPYGDELKPKQFADRYCINENWTEEWADFDKLHDTIAQLDIYLDWAEKKSQNQKELSSSVMWKCYYNKLIN